MMKKHSVLALTLCLAMVVSAAAGCSQKKTSSSEPGSSTASNSSSSSSSSNEKITIKVGMWPDATETDNIAAFKQFQKDFQAKYPNVTVVPDHYDYAVDTFVSMANAGTAPTVFQTWYTEPQKLIKNKLVADCQSEVAALGWDKEMAANIKTLLTGTDGDLYGVPRDAYALGLMINLDLWKKAGLMNADGKTPNYPKTFDQLEQDAVKVKAATGKAGFCLLAMDASGGWHFSNIAWNFGASLEKTDGSGKALANFTDPNAVKAMQFVYNLKWKDNVLTSSPTTVNWANGFVQLGTGNAAMVIAANDAVSQPTTTNGLPASSLALVPMPAGPSGSQYALMGGTPYMFAKNATPAQITACLNWITAIGKGPIVSADALASMESNAKANVKAGTPNIPIFPAWTGSDYIAQANKAVTDNSNIDMADYNDYFTFINKSGSLHPEELYDTQDMYTALTKVLQKVVTDKSTDVAAAMKQANSDFQSKLDQQVNK